MAPAEDLYGFMNCCYSSFNYGLNTPRIHARLDFLFLLHHPVKSLRREDQDGAFIRGLEIQKTQFEDVLQSGTLLFAVIFIIIATPDTVAAASH